MAIPNLRNTRRDRFVSSYTYGPTGVISRHDERGNADPADNQVYWYLPDAMGGNVHILANRATLAPSEIRPPPTVHGAHTDAFGVPMRLPRVHPATGLFAWRGQEGSVTDRDIDLVYMQNRHYDPSLGRFIQADTVLVASMTTQGMNRYVYTENDPVNKSDPTGHFILGTLAFIAGSILGGLLAQSIAGGSLSWPEWFLRLGLSAGLSGGFRPDFVKQCYLQIQNANAILSQLLSAGLISISASANLLLRTFLGFLALPFLVGFAFGFALTSLILLTMRSKSNDGRHLKWRFDRDEAFAAMRAKRMWTGNGRDYIPIRA